MQLFGYEYRLEHFHFHWGESNRVGSEHFLYGRQYPLELHFVFSNTKYENLLSALGNPWGVLVVGALFKLQPGDNDNWTPITSAIERVTRPDERVLIPPVAVKDLLPSLKQSFVYRGSLTTPPCTENVQWVVATRPIGIGPQQLNAFRQVRDEQGRPLLNTFRRLQDPEDRVIPRVF